ncbi:MAG: ferrochelatase [Planctomycetota bacterium]|nr:ferrochelatase [Planctomycetota bacterium]
MTACAVAAGIWILAGGMLAFRGGNMLLNESTASNPARVLATVIGLLIGWAKGEFVLSRSARRNRRRIEELRTPRALEAFSLKFVVLIGIMIGFGAALKWSAREGYLGWVTVGALYVGIGAALLASSRAYLAKPPKAMDTQPGAALTTRPPSKRGVLLVNLGTPDAPTPGAVARYLREFLMDRKVVDAARWYWPAVLNVIVIPLRRRKVAKAYGTIWEEGGSPLLTNTAAAARALGERLAPTPVAVAMRYGNPSLAAGLSELRAQGCDEVLAVPLFPQASDTTTGSIQLALARVAARRPDAQALSILPAFPDDEGYIAALAARVREVQEGAFDRIVLSFHGLPERYVRNGDPYLEQCQRTARALAAELALEDDEWELAFQSRFGDEPWLQPYLEQRLLMLARGGAKRVLVALPGFAADCLETLEEVAEGLAARFRAEGGEELVVVPALNDHPAWIDALESLVRRTRQASAPPKRSAGFRTGT